MTNCKNCGAPIGIYAGRCPYCETPYEAPGGSETGEKLGREMIYSRGLLSINEYREALHLDRFDSEFGEMKTLHAVGNAIGSRWDIDDDYEERAAKYMHGEQIAPKWIQED